MPNTPISFLIGSASAALQIEGGNSKTNWHEWAREPGNINDGSTPERATDHWNRWREDNSLMSELGLQIARIGVEWARIEPEPGVFDEEVLARYREEISDLVKRGIKPLVTLHHFTNPVWFQDMGEFTTQQSPEIFLRFTRKVVEYLGDLVTDWVTINEPNVYAVQAYLFQEGPPSEVSWVKLRKVLRNLAETHCRAYMLIHQIVPEARVTFAHHVRVFAPKDPRNPFHRLFCHVNEYLFHTMIEDAMFSGKFSRVLGAQPKQVKPGRYVDVIGLNYYSRTAVTGPSDGVFSGVPLTDMGWEIYPAGLVQTARRLHQKYPVPIWVTENGCADNGRPELTGLQGENLELEHYRADFLLKHLTAMANSGLPFERYYHWCFVDNWEWSFGEIPRFGIVHLDYDTQKRAIKPSGRMLNEIITHGAITPKIRARYATGYTEADGAEPMVAG